MSPGAVKVHSFPEGKRALLAGKRIQYIGAVGEITGLTLEGRQVQSVASAFGMEATFFDPTDRS